ncbi:hydrogenase 1 maturation protease [Anaerotignum neopropionicum]|uniref:Hydrogenase 1 maturation protease n=1 Tax=Anaerotignum neopropionicum TaxID=36847 RepID=A0A136WD78_9FIRM|nr:hydrogenase maturation protease [Anaerotignum neopropionicum]KXL52436.1 hydrogenase 1 maturation protease [Anaerotignum neopropionicum]
MIKLVATGNRFMKDDGIAIKIAENLEQSLHQLNIEVIIGETDCQSCFFFINPEDFVFILDAFYEGAEPGSVHLFSLEEVIAQSSASFMQHDMNMIELMKLYKSEWKGCFIGVEIAEIGFGDELSPVLQEKFQEICWEVEKNIKKIIQEEITDA